MKKWWLGALALFVLDRLSKRWAQRALAGAGAAQFWPGVVGFRYARNTGVAFSLGSGGGWVPAALAALMIGAVLVVYFRGKDFSRLTRGALVLVAFGGLGNLVDRLLYGYVVDFIELEFVRFAIFNVADTMITLGAALAALGLTRRGKTRDALDG